MEIPAKTPRHEEVFGVKIKIKKIVRRQLGRGGCPNRPIPSPEVRVSRNHRLTGTVSPTESTAVSF